MRIKVKLFAFVCDNIINALSILNWLCLHQLFETEEASWLAYLLLIIEHRTCHHTIIVLLEQAGSLVSIVETLFILLEHDLINTHTCIIFLIQSGNIIDGLKHDLLFPAVLVHHLLNASIYLLSNILFLVRLFIVLACIDNGLLLLILLLQIHFIKFLVNLRQLIQEPHPRRRILPVRVIVVVQNLWIPLLDLVVDLWVGLFLFDDKLVHF